MRYFLFLLRLFFPTSFPPTTFATTIVSRWGDMHVRHFWDVTPHNWEHLSTPPDNTTIDFRISLKSHHENALIKALYEVSSPNHPNYRAHLSQGQVAELVAPHSETLELVTSWLKHHGIPSSSLSMILGGNWLKVTGVPVSLANQLLGASYQHYRHAETNDTILRTMSYSLPVALQDHVQTVVPATHFGLPRTQRKAPSVSDGATAAEAPPGVTSRDNGDNDYITPAYLRKLYNSAGYVPNATGQNVFGISAYDGYSPSPTDLTSFMQQFRPDGINATYTVVKINGGGYDPSEPDNQEDLNVQYALGLTYPTPVIFYNTGGVAPFIPDSSTKTDTNDPYLDWLEYILGEPNIPQTIVSGYAGDEQAVPFDYATSVCDLFAQVGARGSSVIFGSGDGAVGGFDNGSCVANDGSGKVHFLPVFPASCPYVTVVGGTIGDNPEVAASPSGGGFSNYFERPSYQDSVMTTFLQTLGSQHEGLFNASSRGFPDVAAQYYNYAMVLNGTDELSDGTSGAMMAFASVISLLNDYLLSRNEHPLGFLNPWLYTNGRAGLNDITSGSNPGCNTSGFPAIVGWDPVTGLGTPNFVKLMGTLTSNTSSTR